MKHGWEIKKLGEVCSIMMGQSPSSDTYNNSEGLPFFQGNADFGRMHPTVRVYCNAPIRIADVGDILISVRAPIGAINISDVKCCIGRGLAAVRGSNKIRQEFIYHSLVANREKLISQGTGSTFKSISKNVLTDLLIPVPTIAEQEKIVAELDCLSGIIEKKKQQLKELDNLVQSIFYTTFGDPISNDFGWEAKKLSEVCPYITDGSHYSPKEDVNGTIPMLSVKDMRQSNFSYESCKMIGDEEYQKLLSNGCKPLKDDVLVAKDGSYFKYIFALKEEREQALLSSIAIVRPDKSVINPIYLVGYLSTTEIYNEVEREYLTGTAIKRVILKGLRSMRILLPPLHLQQEFASKIQSIEKQKELIAQSIKETETLFNSRMDYYFN